MNSSNGLHWHLVNSENPNDVNLVSGNDKIMSRKQSSNFDHFTAPSRAPSNLMMLDQPTRSVGRSMPSRQTITYRQFCASNGGSQATCRFLLQTSILQTSTLSAN